MWAAPEMSGQCRLKGREVGGSQCREIGGRIGRATTFWMVNPSLLGSPLATAEHLFRETWLRPVGPLARPSPAVNSGEELSHRERVVSSFRFLGFYFYSVFLFVGLVGRGGVFLILPPALLCLNVYFYWILMGKVFFVPLFC